MAVPPRLTDDPVALHGFEPGKQIFECPGLDMVHARHAVGGRRTFVEHPTRAGRRLLERPLEGLALLPAGQHLPLHVGQVDLRGERLEPLAHGWIYLQRPVRTQRDEALSGPAVPPSLAAPGARPASFQSRPPGLLGSPEPFFRPFRGDQTAAHTSGLAPPPDRCRARSQGLRRRDPPARERRRRPWQRAQGCLRRQVSPSTRADETADWNDCTGTKRLTPTCLTEPPGGRSGLVGW